MGEIRGTRQDTFDVELSVLIDTHWIDYGTFDTRTGGELDSEERLYYPGNMQDPYALGGRINPGQLTISRNYRIGRDHDNLQQLINGVGKYRATITQVAMDRWGVKSDSAIVWNGILKTVTFPEHNSESATDPAMIELVFTIDQSPVGPLKDSKLHKTLEQQVAQTHKGL